MTKQFSKIFLHTMTLSMAFLLFFVPSLSAEQRKKNHEIACPPIIADNSRGIFRKNKQGDRTSPFRCFRNKDDAKKSGFDSNRVVASKNFSGWYRLNLNLVKDTCQSFNPSSPVFFLQVKENDSGLFGAFCPLTGDLSGIRSGNGITLSSINEFFESPALSLCTDGHVREHQYVEVSRVVSGSTAFNATYKEIRSCLSPGMGGVTCTREYTGIAFYETHKIWPTVSNDITQMAPGCQLALTKCADCHTHLTP